MNIDLTKLMTNNVDAINIDIDVYYDSERLKKVNINELKDVTFKGKIRKLYDADFELEGVLSGIMVLSDDITLEDVDYKFSVSILENFNEIDENLDNNLIILHNKLDVSEFLWQNIVLEVPLKVVSEKNKDLTLKGEGWRFITEEELEKENLDKSPFSVLDDK